MVILVQWWFIEKWVKVGFDIYEKVKTVLFNVGTLSLAVTIAGNTGEIYWPIFTKIGVVFSMTDPAMFAGKILFFLKVLEQFICTLKTFSSPLCRW